jgi:membrane-associated protease RseP (regulator of RpoE activity)
LSSFDSLEVPRAVAAPAPPRDRVWLHVLLLLLTFVTTTMVGADAYGGFITDFGQRRVPLTYTTVLLNGLWYSVPALAILGAHEMGHYLACRYYGINASLPYFIPMFRGVSIFGTLGAVIRIREPLRTKRMLFDVGVAGPIAGFVVAVPTLILGMKWSRVIRLPPHLGGIDLGEPWLFQLVKHFFFGNIPKGLDVNMHPMVLAAWFGLFATALNLMPLGQLDGGHITYANLGRRANYVTYIGLGILFVLGVTVSANWLFWGVLMLGMLYMFGWEHPPTADERDNIGLARVLITLFAIVMFALCFTAVPMTALLGR